jgi:uncharacterized membrane protein YheB (UPF0754 family)
MSLALYLTNALVGAALGAGTNALALRMIFRYLLPRSKPQIANAIRNIVATELFTPAKIVERLDYPEVRAPLRRGAAEWIDSFLDRDLPSWNALTAPKRESLGPREDALFDDLLKLGFEHLGSDEFREDTLRPFLERQWNLNREKPPTNVWPDLPELLRQDFPPMLSAWLASDNFRGRANKLVVQVLRQALDRAETLADLIPQPIHDSVDEILEKRTPWLMELFASALEEPAMQERLVQMVEDALRRNTEKSEGLLGGIKAFATQQLADVRGAVGHLPEAVRRTDAGEFAPILRESLERVWRRPWHDFVPDDDAKIRGAVSILIDQVLSRESRAAAVDAVARSLVFAARKPFELWRSTLDPSLAPKERIERLAAWLQQALISSPIRETVRERVKSMVSVAKATPIGRPGRWVTPAMRDDATGFMADAVTEAIRERLADFAEQSGLWDIVRDTINQYSDRKLEEVIRGIANKELVHITMIGGVIGAVVGFAQSFIPGVLAWLQGA